MTTNTRRLKIIFITTWYPTREDPVSGIFIREHAKAVKLFDDIIVIHCAGFNPKIRGLWRIEEERDDCLTEGILTYRVWTKVRSSVLLYFGAFKIFRELLKKGFKPNIIHAHMFRAGVLAIIIGRIYRLPVIVTEHWTKFPRKQLKIEDILMAKFVFQNAKVVLPVCRSLQRAIEEHGIKANFRIIPNTVDTNLFCYESKKFKKCKRKKLLFVGLFDPSHKKGFPYLLKALHELKKERNDWYLDVIGDGPTRPEYEKMVKHLGLEKNVCFHKLKPKQEIARFMRQADIFVLPSIWENLPCVLIEAMACGLPIVATNVGGIPEIINEKVGILCPPKNWHALYRALDVMLNSVHKYDRKWISDYAKRNFDISVIGEQLHKIYLEFAKE